MQYNIFQNLPAQAMTPEVSRKLLAYQEGEGGYTVNLMQAKAGAQAPAHSHPHQQVVYIISGRGDFLCGQETQTLTAGDVVQIAADVPHTFVSVAEDAVWLEFFTPAREDYRPQI
ncbi:MAG: cupin domain-containing protein [Peptococcaceae bacterium]|jgi:quercetin dioxygenase-like cupin family protein|nr:cupin domain-containing protein [Peptococcaceae bacterium]